MIKLRLKRLGRTHRPFYRINAIDSRNPRDGRVVEQLGYYDPLVEDDKQVKLNAERCKYWLDNGAQPSETVRDILRKNGVEVKEARKKNPSAKAKAAPAE